MRFKNARMQVAARAKKALGKAATASLAGLLQPMKFRKASLQLFRHDTLAIALYESRKLIQ